MSLEDYKWITYDFEVFCANWLVVFKERDTGEYTAIWNDNDELREYMEDHEGALFVSYNGAHYDQWIMRAILGGCGPEEVKEVNDWIVGTDNLPWEHPYLEGVFYDYNDVDLMKDTQMGTSLKSIEAHSGMSVEESEVPFDIDRALTLDEMDEVEHYCRHDVDATEKLLGMRHDYLLTKATLGERAGLEVPKALALTNAKLTAAVLGAQRVEHDDEREYVFPSNLDLKRLPLTVIGFFKRVRDESIPDEELWTSKLNIDVGGCPVVLGFGGIHGALPTYREEATEDRCILNIDVASYYPSLMIRNGYTSRNMPDPKVFENIYEERLTAKHSGDKATANALKLIVNTTYGATLNRYNDLYDPLQARSVCISGQLYLLELAEHLVSDVPTLTLVQLNTDGIMVSVDKAHVEEVRGIYHEWEERTGFVLEEDDIARVWQKDVNNFAARFTNGHDKVKGGYLVRGASTVGAFSINQNATIIADALRAFLLDGTPVAETIDACDDPAKFQLIAKAGHKFSRVYQLVADEEVERQKCNRVFACTYEGLGRLYKVKAADGRVAKVESLPDHCLVRNGDYPDISEIDKQWYIALAEKRAHDFEGASMAETTASKTAPKRRTAAKSATPDYSKMNVYQKLAIARKMFLDRGVQRSGTNNNAEYDYFELTDIVPAQTAIFAEVGLLETFTYSEPKPVPVSLGDHWEPHFTEPMAVSKVINVDDPEQVIEFRLKWGEIAPIISKRTGKPVNQPIQNNGGEQTYMRRYLKMQVLDIVEHDATDEVSREDIEQPVGEPKEKAPSATETPVSATVSTSTGDKPSAAKAPRKRAQKPVTQSERKQTAKALTNADGAATPLQVRQLQKTLRTLMDAYGDDHAELGTYVAELGAETDNLKSITKARCAQAIRDLGEMKEKFETEGNE